MTGKTALITGGSSGLGFQISRHFAQHGFHILWISLFEREMEDAKAELKRHVPGVKVDTLTQDLTSEDMVAAVQDWVHAHGWTINVLINNAGRGSFGFATDLDPDREVEIIKLNVLSVHRLTRLFLSEMIQRDEGTIILISSNSSFHPIPKMATYSATKAFISHFGRALTEELNMQRSNVRVMTVCPAAFGDSAFQQTAKMEKVRTFRGLAATTSTEVAQDIWRGYTTGTSFVVSGWKQRLLRIMTPFIPNALMQHLIRREIKEDD